MENYSVERVSGLLEAAEILNESKKGIDQFLAMFVHNIPMEEIQKWVGSDPFDIPIRGLELEKDFLRVQALDHRVGIHVNGMLKDSCSLTRPYSLPRHMIMPIWLTLPDVLDVLAKLFPKYIGAEVELYERALKLYQEAE